MLRIPFMTILKKLQASNQAIVIADDVMEIDAGQYATHLTFKMF